MPRATQSKVIPFEPVADGPEITGDPLNRRVMAMFDALRKRGVGPDKAAWCISQVFAKGVEGSGHPLQSTPPAGGPVS